MGIVRTSIQSVINLWGEYQKDGFLGTALTAFVFAAFLFLLNLAYFSLGAALLVFAWNGAIAPFFHAHLWSFPLALSVLVCLAFAFWVVERVSANIRGK